MLQMDKYYYSDAMFQLEINLHKVRKELINMLEFYEQTDCENCLLLKCKCTKTDKKSSSDKQTRSTDRSDCKSKSNNTPCGNENKDKHSPAAEVLPQTKQDKNDQSPAPSTPEKLTVTKDIEAWMDASKNLEDYTENMVLNPKKSLVTIESVRPADLPLKTLQKSSVLNYSNVLNSPRSQNTTSVLGNSIFLNSPNVINNATLEAFLKYIKPQMSDSQVTYMSTKLAAACKKQIKQNYSYF